MKLYPVMLNIEGKLVAVIGGGEVAYRKVKDLLDCDARVRVVAPEIHASLKELKKQETQSVEIVEREYRDGDLTGVCLVYSATDIREINEKVYRDASSMDLFVNAVDDPPHCSFYVPSWTSRGDLILALSTTGASPAYAARLRRSIEETLPDNIEEILLALRELREMLKGEPSLSVKERGVILKELVKNDQSLQDLIDSKKSDSLGEYARRLQKNR